MRWLVATYSDSLKRRDVDGATGLWLVMKYTLWIPMVN
jgi:hypothetical protein